MLNMTSFFFYNGLENQRFERQLGSTPVQQNNGKTSDEPGCPPLLPSAARHI
jgi:hypothetical protein